MQTFGDNICQNIVIVGNSPVLLEAENGKIIDQFYKVVRVGRFVIEGFERYVGIRTDYNITRPPKLRLMSHRSRETIDKYIVTEDTESSLGIHAIDTVLDMFPDRKITIAGYTQNLALNVHNDTKYAGKYFMPDYKQWNDYHNLVKEDIYLNKLIAEKKVDLL